MPFHYDSRRPPMTAATAGNDCRATATVADPTITAGGAPALQFAATGALGRGDSLSRPLPFGRALLEAALGERRPTHGRQTETAATDGTACRPYPRPGNRRQQA